MLDLNAADPVADAHHQKFLDAALPEGLRRDAFARFDPKVYAPEVIEKGLFSWQLRTLDEYRSQVALTQLLGELTELGAAFDVLGLGIRVVRDEARHVELCRRMVRALGGSDELPGEPGWLRADPSWSILDRVLWVVVGFLCIGETVSTSLILEVRDNSADPLSHEVLSQLAADESIHGQFGWVLLKLLEPLMGAAERDRLRGWMPNMFSMVREAVARSGAPGKQPPNPFGGASRERRIELLDLCLRDEVMPKLGALGLDFTDKK